MCFCHYLTIINKPTKLVSRTLINLLIIKYNSLQVLSQTDVFHSWFNYTIKIVLCHMMRSWFKFWTCAFTTSFYSHTYLFGVVLILADCQILLLLSLLLRLENTHYFHFSFVCYFVYNTASCTPTICMFSQFSFLCWWYTWRLIIHFLLSLTCLP